ncbi:hypothetical protein J3Q64DRAFT_1846330 [Phycomyces blakesleeanus]|uniref:RRM domain-containing protein n=2 Tax=Phycomyces blakesleeanus TaxID=4837 RepID=A0A167QY24_PHYB8|nr:hypothetical protein PHYBLDRAFT_138011 [Phycomyces blakesleeanus NRRL 1555(-)]OAD80450.1 hypothetical protein PHYBLDRAFT_138011 [Phycomyces blakesleeanus NRRL 1555(-)]|eukprot:XP_018298490.1 hypothetical protein PHYBLDRAFT_138011 [Phycomyces blakesleeanus NRRL 1555(-)]
MIEYTVNEGCKTIRVSNLDTRITSKMLTDIFSMISSVKRVKITDIECGDDLSHGFIEFHEHQAAEQALQAMNGRAIFGQKIQLSWATNGYSTPLPETDNHVHQTIRVDHLSPDTKEEEVAKSFSVFPGMLNARIVWNPSTGKPKGFGLITFNTKENAENAMTTMTGKSIGSNKIECSWLDTAVKITNSPTITSTTISTDLKNKKATVANMTYEQIFAQAPLYNTTVYVGNLPRGITRQQIGPFFQQYGFVSDILERSNDGYALVKLDTHANASSAILALQGFNIGGQPIELSWGKDTMLQSNNEFYAGENLRKYTPGQAENNNWVLPGTGLCDYNTMRPPAPVAGSQGNTDNGTGVGQHGWNQYYQHYYSAGHQSI